MNLKVVLFFIFLPVIIAQNNEGILKRFLVENKNKQTSGIVAKEMALLLNDYLEKNIEKGGMKMLLNYIVYNKYVTDQLRLLQRQGKVNSKYDFFLLATSYSKQELICLKQKEWEVNSSAKLLNLVREIIECYCNNELINKRINVIRKIKHFLIVNRGFDFMAETRTKSLKIIRF